MVCKWRKLTFFSFRGMCSVVCKWSYIADSASVMAWDETFFNAIGLEDLAQDGFAKIGDKYVTIIF